MNTTNDTSATTEVENLNVVSQQVLPSPATLKRASPAPEETKRSVRANRRAISAVLDGRDQRLLVVVGPCSIHNVNEAYDYARKLQSLAEEVSDNLLIIMRAYFEKPRTTVGWKGLINDPFLDDSFRIETGLQMARQLLLDIASMGLALGTEALDPITPQYLHDLISWTAIGARTTESQTHRELASGLSTPVGFKNGTDGGLEVALNALQSAAHPHRFLGINGAGEVAVTTTSGNPAAHIVLRGGSTGPNFDRVSIATCEAKLAERGLACNIMIDASHANSGKDPLLQHQVATEVVAQLQAGNTSIIGLMFESNLASGRQDLHPNTPLIAGVSLTDACISFAATADLLRYLNRELAMPLGSRERKRTQAA